MLGLTRKTDYALVALAILAQEQATVDHPLSARQVAQAAALPLPLLMHLLQTLHKAGVLGSARGAGGGYYLRRQPNDISVLQVIEIIDPPLRLTPCCDGEPPHQQCQPCRIMQRCPITGSVRRLNEQLAQFMQGISIADLLRAPAAATRLVGLRMQTERSGS